MTTEQIIWNFLKSKDLNDFAAAGIMGNLQAESGLRSNNLEDNKNVSLGSDEEYTQKVDNGTYPYFITDNAGYGLAQWTTSDRKRKLYNICQANNKSISDLSCQLVLLYEELKSLNILSQLQNATNVRQATVTFLTKFEKPAGYNTQKVQNARTELAQQFYDNLKATKGGLTMKYVNNNGPIVCMQTNSTCYKETTQMEIKGILWHSTGANNPNLKRYVQPSEDDPNYNELMNLLGENTARNDWNHISMQAGLNAWIGKLANGQVATVQTMPWNYRPWGCGTGARGSCNSGWIQFEICEDGLTDKNYFDKIYQEACELCAFLCKKFNLNPKGNTNLNGTSVPVILCHQDSAQLGLGSNHADIYHWFNKFGKNMDTVRNDIAAIIADATSSNVVDTDDVEVILSDGILRKGDEGPEVTELQNNLIKLGYSVGRWGADGDFGSGTEEAVMNFQRDYGLDDDGEVGPLTKQAIQKAIERSSTPQIYRVRKSWNNAASQAGAFTNLDNAKQLCDKLGTEYSVFDNTGRIMYSPANNEGTVSPDYHIVPAKTYSDVMIGSASKDENGKYSGGQPGDQTNKEVWILNWYNQNWTSVLRPKDSLLAEKIAIACEAACANNNVGYNQLTRNSLLKQAKYWNFDISKIDLPCDCDCSSLVSTCCVCAGLPESMFFPYGNGCTTWTIADACLKTGRFDELTDTKYLRQKDYLQRGDILLNRNEHVVVVLANGSQVQNNPMTQPEKDNTYNATTFLVRVTVPSLNIRKEPSMAADIVAQIKKGGVFTIIATQGGFGRLKSGAGWIDLTYVEKI